LPEPQIAARSRHPLDPRRILTLKILKQPPRDITPIDHHPSGIGAITGMPKSSG